MTASYAAFFNGGHAVTPHAILAATADRKPVAVAWAAPRRAVDADLAAMMVRMMAAVVRTGTGRAAAVPAASPPARPAPRKTTATPGSSAVWTATWSACGSATMTAPRCAGLWAGGCRLRCFAKSPAI
ncbi:MAG: hypothetical protein WDN04_27565 [Rhodospirillales bacterium]